MQRPRRPRSLLDEIVDPLILIGAQLHFALSMYVRAMAVARPQDDPYLRPWKIAKDATWLLLLVVMYLQYYFIDVFSQIAVLPTLDARV